MNKIKMVIRRKIQDFILWYLRRAGGAFHANEYGPDGLYITYMTDWQYHW